MSLSSILGTALLLGSVLIVSLAMKAKNEKEYKLAMAEYERKMEEYNAAVAAIESGADFAASADGVTAAELAAATAAIAAAEQSISEGEVKLLGVSEENAAMIIAILCDELGCNRADLTFRSITAL